ncbi:D-Ala-D-Ala carboxypeptidase family metallohydrolase [Prevotella sp. HUN102]|uniref:D-Ala-D-Ala carboxypeptidase family metallohydrolase n=1 Tax=Prevotella sp. HUN102 TaxID=1392486 RepID=UPI001E597010|nr:D-Ala-D-Ala carboxypeptidase family metallohydrolase [Prevotella sp. HUN102]
MIDYEEKLSPHFTVGEMLRSGIAIQRNIKNVPSAHPEDGLTDEEMIRNLRALCVNVLEPLRRRVGRVIVTSGYRCKQLNKAVGGVPNSLHIRGMAVDIHVSNMEMCRRYERVLRSLGKCTELVLEPRGMPKKRWIHVGVEMGNGKREM